MSLKSINPATLEIIQEHEAFGDQKIETVISSCHESFLQWRKSSLAIRSEKLKKLASVLRSHLEEYARLITLEMGKPIAQSRSEIEKCAWVCEYFSEHGPTDLKRQNIATDAKKSFVTFEPLGVVLAVMPWNFPFWQAFRCLAPTLLAGNGIVLKHSSNVSGCALAIEKSILEAGFPENLFSTLLIGSDKVSAVISNLLVQAVTLTGSTSAGRSVAEAAGRVIKKCVLELGGSDPYLILADADLKLAAKTCAVSRVLNTGQSCISAKRFIVVEAVADEFTRLFVEEMRSQNFGDPFDHNVKLGPLARLDLRDELHEQVQKSLRAGAQCLLGGEIPNQKGAFYPATVLTRVEAGMPAYHEELFGPVASVITVPDEERAVKVANDSIYGLGSAIFSQDLKRAEELAAHALEAGNCFINGMVRSDPRLPFGGVKESGYGRELSAFGLREFVNIKSVCIF